MSLAWLQPIMCVFFIAIWLLVANIVVGDRRGNVLPDRNAV